MGRRALVIALVACACGGEPSPAPQHATTPTSNEEEATSNEEEETSNKDEAELASALRREGVTACARACARLTSCAATETDECHRDCVDVLAREQAAPAVRYAACVDGLSCEAIKKSMGMGMGPVGMCYVEAQRMAR